MLAIICFGLIAHGQAITLDWNNVNWTASTNYGGTTSQSFDIDSNNPGNDITISIGDPYSNLRADIIDNTKYNGGYGSTEESLYVAAGGQGVNEAIIVTITFLYSENVTNVDFTLFDIDYNSGQFRDIATDFVATENGSSVGSVSLTDHEDNNIYPVNFSSGGYSYAGPFAYGVGENPPGDDSGGNVDVSFGSAELDQITFRYENYANTGNQAFTLYDINFTVLPEAGTSIAGWMLVFAACVSCWNRHRQQE